MKMCKDVWEALDWHIDAQEELRNEITSLLENASHSIQFSNNLNDVVEVLVELFNELVKVLKVEQWR